MDTVFAAKMGLARAVGVLSRRAGRGGGTTLPGRLLERLAPDAVERLAGRLGDGLAMLSATNGKTTTAAMAAAIVGPERRLCRNGSGANLVSGVASALLGCDGARLGLFEVDEAALPALVRRTSPRALLLANLFRDQLDRYGELELVADRWRAMVGALGPGTQLVVNADDPVLGALAPAGGRAVTFGFDDPSHALPALDHASDSTFCIRCGTAYAYRAAYLGHLGDYECPACGHARPPLDFAARNVEPAGLEGTRFRLDTPAGSVPVWIGLPGIYNVYNAVAAVALGAALGVAPAAAAERLAGFRAAFGRFERLQAGDREVVLLLIKNPAGANEALRTLAPVLDGATVLLALSDRTADGRDVSWIWDVDLEPSLPRAGTVVCSGTRAFDMAVRVKYAGVPEARVVVQPDLEAAFDRACDAAGAGGTAYVLPTYTAMLELQRLATARGLRRPYWEAAPC